METPDLLQDSQYGIAASLKDLIGSRLIRARYFILYEYVLPNCRHGQWHTNIDFGELVTDKGDVYRFYGIFDFAGPPFHTLAMTPPSFYIPNRSWGVFMNGDIASIDMSALGTWSAYIGSSIVEVTLGWWDDDWPIRLPNPPLHKAVMWIQILFDNDLQVLICSGDIHSRESTYKGSEKPLYFKVDEDKNGDSIYFSYEPEDMCLIFDSGIAEIVMERSRQWPSSKGEFTKISADGCRDGVFHTHDD